MKSIPLAIKLSAASICCVLTAAAAAAAPAQQVFRATLDIVETVVPVSTKTCYALGTIAGNGWATYLDAVTGTSQDCINTQGTGYAFSTVQPLTLRSLKGNLFVCYRGNFVQESTGGVVYLIDGVYRIIGGTVTFQGARGTGTMQGIEDLTAVLVNRGQVSLNGVITYGSMPAGPNEADCSSL